MADEHLRYERLAVGHVVGGLDEVDAARFRTHLLSCRVCRTRVAELRGIASDLVATEREERAARARVGQTEVAERVEEEAPPRAPDVTPTSSWPWRVIVVGLVPLLLLGVLAWAVWMRAEVHVRDAALAASTSALRVAAEGVPLALTVEDATSALTGTASSTTDHVALAVSGLPQLGPNEAIRADLLDENGTAVVVGTPFSSAQLEAGFLYAVLDRRGATTADATTVALRTLRYDSGDLVVVQELATASLP